MAVQLTHRAVKGSNTRPEVRNGSRSGSAAMHLNAKCMVASQRRHIYVQGARSRQQHVVHKAKFPEENSHAI